MLSNKVYILILLIVIILFSGCVEEVKEIDFREFTKPEIDINSLEKQIHILINQERENQGLSKLAWDNNLASIARAHSEDMSQRNYFTHDSLEGCDPTCRANKAGYNCHKDFGGGWYSDGIAENIAQDNLAEYIYDDGRVADYKTQEEIAESTVNGLMNSPGHRENILTPEYDKEGIGIAINSNDEVLVTQNFC